MSCGCWVSVPPDVRRLDAGGLRAGLGGGLAAGFWGGSHRNGRSGEVAAARYLKRVSRALSPPFEVRDARRTCLRGRSTQFLRWQWDRQRRRRRISTVTPILVTPKMTRTYAAPCFSRDDCIEGANSSRREIHRRDRSQKLTACERTTLDAHEPLHHTETPSLFARA